MCVIEVYEYELVGYHKTDPRYFDEERLCESPSCPCGKVQAYTEKQNQKGGTTRRSSCDLLNSKIGRRVNKDAVPQHFLYTNFPTKATPAVLLGLLDPDARRCLGYDDTHSLFLLIRSAYLSMDKLTRGGGVKIREHLDRPAIMWDSRALTYLLDVSKKGFLFHWRTRNDMIMMGDLHGSFHTFWRHMLRLRAGGILTSLKTMSVREGVTLVFTGDMTDRGMYSFDILVVILRLVSSNPPGSVVVVRGNHESWGVNTKSGFLEELKVKFGFTEEVSLEESRSFEGTFPEYACYSKRLADADGDGGEHLLKGKAWHVLMQLQKFYSSCPCAVVAENRGSGERIWISHGGVPMTKVDLGKGMASIPLSNEQTEACMWHDFFTTTDKNLEFDVQKNTGRTRIFPKYMRSFMKTHKLSFIIRGHQDSYANTYLLSNNVVEELNASGSRFDLPGRYHQVEGLIHVAPEDNNVQGPIARVFTSASSWLGPKPLLWTTPEGQVKVYPVMVIATCTDLGRYHMKDSMIYMTFSHDVSLRGLLKSKPDKKK